MGKALYDGEVTSPIFKTGSHLRLGRFQPNFVLSGQFLGQNALFVCVLNTYFIKKGVSPLHTNHPIYFVH